MEILHQHQQHRSVALLASELITYHLRQTYWVTEDAWALPYPSPVLTRRGKWRLHGLRWRPGILGASGPAVVAHAARLALHISRLTHLGRLIRAAHLLLGLGGRAACLLCHAERAARIPTYDTCSCPHKHVDYKPCMHPCTHAFLPQTSNRCQVIKASDSGSKQGANKPDETHLGQQRTCQPPPAHC